MIRALLALCLLGLPFVTAAESAGVFTPEELAARLATVPASAPIESKPLAGRVDEIHALLTVAPGDPVTEKRLRDLILSLPDASPSPEQRRLLESAAHRADSVFIRLPDHAHAARPIVAISPASAAKWKQQRAQVTRARDRLAGLLRDGQIDPARLAALQGIDAIALPETADVLSVQDLARARDALGAALPGSDAVTTLAARAAILLEDETLARAVVERGTPGPAARALPVLVASLAERAAPVLDAALQRPALAEHAIAAHAPLLATDAVARTRLLDSLGDPVLGPAAAATLARARDASVQQDLFGILLAGPGPRARHAALALYLDGSPGARDQLARYLGTGRPDLAREVTQWLAH